MDTFTEPHWDRAALLTIDLQNDFIQPGTPATIPGTDRILDSVARLVSVFRQHNRPIFHAIRLYSPDGENAELCRRAQILDAGAMVAPNTNGAELASELKTNPWSMATAALLQGEMQTVGANEWIFYKPRWSAFFETKLAARLEAEHVDTLIVAGSNAPNCPAATLFDASARDFRMVLVTDAVSRLDDNQIQRFAGIGAVGCTVNEVATGVSASLTRI